MGSETTRIYLERLLSDALFSLQLAPSGTSPEISFPDEKFGDYATNAALALGKSLKQNPQGLAEKIAAKLKELDKAQVFGQINAASGFVNLRLSQRHLAENLGKILLEKENFGSSGLGRQQKILVEYFQPNIAKPLHLGHLRTAIIGDCFFRLFAFAGFKPESDTHLGDWGTQFGLLLHAFKKYGNLEEIKEDPINELNKLYVKVNAEAEERPEVRDAGKVEFVKLEQGDEENRKLWKTFKDWSWQEFEFVYSDLGIRRSDHDWPESFFEDKMPKVLEALRSKKLLAESQGAKIVDLSEYNLGVALLLKSDGGTTYLLRDLATYIYRKSQGFQKQYYVVDVRQSHTLAQTFKILELLGHIVSPDEAVHIAYGFLTLPEGAMSTRRGTVVGAKEFIENVEERALEIIKEKNPGLEGKEAVAKKVAIAAIKYFDLSHNIKSDIVFDPKKAISFEGNTGPYLQYTHARIHGILRKASSVIPSEALDRSREGEVEGALKLSNGQGQGISPLSASWRIGRNDRLNNYEISVLRKLHRFPEIVEQAARDLQPNIIANYLFEFSQTFNAFYQEVPVLSARGGSASGGQEEDEAVRSFRLNLITATAQVIKNGLNLLGIEAPEEM